MATTMVDLDKPGKYPIVLSDALLGRASTETFTSIRYNHKPDPSSDSSSSSLQLKPSNTNSSEFDLSLTDNSEEYSYHGTRTSGDGQYVLIFDPVKKHFVLHQVDSTFDMNLVSVPWGQDASALRSQYPQLASTSKPQAGVQRKTAKPAKNAGVNKGDTKRRKSVQAKKPKPPPREPTPEEEEESDDGLTIEYPDAPNSNSYQHQSTASFQRDISEDISDEDEDEDAEGEEDEQEERNQDVDLFKLPSPVNNNASGMSDEDMELDLEAELEQALKETAENREDESDESEEE